MCLSVMLSSIIDSDVLPVWSLSYNGGGGECGQYSHIQDIQSTLSMDTSLKTDTCNKSQTFSYLTQLNSGAPNGSFRWNICSEDL